MDVAWRASTVMTGNKALKGGSGSQEANARALEEDKSPDDG